MMPMVLALICFLGLAMAQGSSLDPSIFDGTGVGRDGGTPPPPGGSETDTSSTAASGQTDTSEIGGSEETGDPEEAALPVPEAPASPEGTEENPEETPAGLPGEEESGVPEEDLEGEEGQGEELAGEEPGSSGALSPAGGPSRAGEEVETSTRVVPGQAVDLPWDL